MIGAVVILQGLWIDEVPPMSGYGAAGDAPRRKSSRLDKTGGLSPRAEATDYEVRSLLHLIALASYCLQNCAPTEDERAQWLREIERAQGRLEQLAPRGPLPQAPFREPS